jgi:hypothetical protein
MPSQQPKDRASLCLFTFTDGRRCRTPRTTGHSHFCFYHARKESQARVAETLGNDLNFFLSGEYLSANDLAVALGRIIPAVVRGDLKPRTATTVAYLAQTLLQTIHLAQDEYINAFSNRVWGETIRNAVRQNWKYRHPAPPPNAAPAPAPPPNSSANIPSAPAPTSNPSVAPSNDCHSEPNEASPPGQEPALSAAHSPLVTLHSPLPQAEGSNPIPTTQFAPSAPAAQPGNPSPTRPSTPHLPQIATPTPFTSTTTVASESTANSLRINTYNIAHKC